MSPRFLYCALICAGLLPFFAAALLPYLGVAEVPYLGGYREVLVSYGVIIASFMAGAHWGTYLYQSDSAPLNLFVTSNSLAVVLWFTFLTADARLTMAILMLAFACLLFVDYRLKCAAVLSAHYFRWRAIATSGVLLALGAALLAP